MKFRSEQMMQSVGSLLKPIVDLLFSYVVNLLCWFCNLHQNVKLNTQTHLGKQWVLWFASGCPSSPCGHSDFSEEAESSVCDWFMLWCCSWGYEHPASNIRDRKSFVWLLLLLLSSSGKNGCPFAKHHSALVPVKHELKSLQTVN